MNIHNKETYYEISTCTSVKNLRIKNSSHLVDAFNVDPIYLPHKNEGKIPDYKVRTFSSLNFGFDPRLLTF